MKKILTSVETVVPDMCNGIVLAHPELELVAKYKVIKKKALNKNKVTLISGGGSGHEPAHAGFIGKGLLDAAVCGDVFASPSQIQVYQAIKETESDKGTLLIIKNYSGDMMNFQNAAYLAAEDGIEVDYVKVDDDVAVEDSLYTVGRRGVAGTVFVHKIAGAAAEQGKSLAEVKALAERTAAKVRTIGFALTSCTVPAKGSPTFTLEENEMEYGVGIHGEPGIRRETIIDAHELAGRMIGSLCNDLHIKTNNGGRVALLVNGFGATPLMELYLLNSEVSAELGMRGVTLVRTFVGNFMTSIDMSGASVSLLDLDGEPELEALLNEVCEAPGLKVSGPVEVVTPQSSFPATAEESAHSVAAELPAEYAVIGKALSLENMLHLVDQMSVSIIKNEVPFCELDSHAGDGDFGMSVAKGFRQLKTEWQSILDKDALSIGGFLNECSMIIMEHCGGASGPIWGSAFRSAAKSTEGKTELSVADFAAMLHAAVAGIQAMGERSFGRGATVGDKTLIDALVPCAEAWSASAAAGDGFAKAFAAGAAAAVEGAKSTESIVARMGRAGTVGARSIGYPDAGAHALGIIFTDITNTLK